MSELAPAPDALPVLPLRDVVVFPHMVTPLFVGRERSVAALERAMAADRSLLLVAQKDAAKDTPRARDLYAFGTLAGILQLLKLPDGTIKVLVEGRERATIAELREDNGCFVARHAIPPAAPAGPAREREVLMRNLLEQFDEFVRASQKIPAEVLTALREIEDLGRLADTVATHLTLRPAHKQELLEELDPIARTERLLAAIASEMELLQVEKRMRGRVKRQMEKSQREYYLNEQMKAIQRELGDLEEGGSELDELERRIAAAGMSKEARARATAELGKLRLMSPMSAEATVVRNYLDWLLAVPWKKASRLRQDLAAAQAVLDADHFGLERVKDRILEYLAVQQRVKKLKGPIICLVGPPGVGKTSLGRSIARATGREFVRMSLGGVRDEAEIRGHRRTYIGALPGKVLQNLAKAGTRNPVFMLDEVDKMAMDFRGDPASALLEVLDPEQNHAFSDHYLEVDFDLSDVMFVATANTLDIPPALLDRMEVIRISGYTEDEKLAIARRYLVPKALEQNGLREGELAFTDAALRAVARHYTREAGVRNLEREINKVCRKAVKQQLLRPRRGGVRVTPHGLRRYLGVARHRHGLAGREDRVGLVNGLAWTEAGGELLTVEATAVPGKGALALTGQLGEVMQESVRAALTVVRSRAPGLSIAAEAFQNHDFHVHVPEGATPKDGPSAGIAMCTALVSALTGLPVRADLAMTGEITLRGEVLPVGGVKEKLLGAQRAGIRTVLIPSENRKDLEEVPANVLRDLSVQAVERVDEVLARALVGDAQAPLAAPEAAPQSPAAGGEPRRPH